MLIKYSFVVVVVFRYVVIKKLGWGHFSTVWMVKDRQKAAGTDGDNCFYALKVQKSAEHYTEAAMDEVELLDCMASERKAVEAALVKDGTSAQLVEHSRFVATLHDSFFHTGPNGRHMCMVFSMLGCNLLSVIKAYNYRGIPLPVVKKMVKGILKGLDFLHRKCHIIHTDLKPENVLLQFPHQITDELDQNLTSRVAAVTLEDENDGKRNSIGQSIHDMEKNLNDPNLPVEERKRLKKRLKRKRQKERKRTFGMSRNDDASSSSEEGTKPKAFMLSDMEMGKILRQAAAKSVDATHSRVRQRVGYSPFLTTNFALSPEQFTLPEELQVETYTERELAAELLEAEADGGLAKISIVLRSFTPEEELADAISTAICASNSWEATRSGREWRVGLRLGDATTCFRLTQHVRKDINDNDRDLFANLIALVSENLADSTSETPESPDVGAASKAMRPLPSSLFTAQFPVRSMHVVLSFLESRVPGLVFLSYKRGEGNPSLDSCVFGPGFQSVCRHPLAMKVKEDALNPTCTMASTLFGFDLRLVKDFGARPTVDSQGASSFGLGSNEKVESWWNSRQPMHDRIKAFTGMDPGVELINLVDRPVVRESRLTADLERLFQEGGKKSSGDASTAPSSRDTSASSAARTHNQQPDLQDVDMLMQCRTVIVDLGNACWTHRHFSEDIQTRQYRSPEVLIGSKYDTSADLWSLGCMTFELLTGDLLFDPRAGEDYDRDEDHLAMFQELLGKIPKKLALEGKYSKNFFDKKGNLKRIKQLKFWPVQDVLKEKYHFSAEEAQGVADFMGPLLDFDPHTRATALQALDSEWLR